MVVAAAQEITWEELADQSQDPPGFTYDGLLINGTQDYDCPCTPGLCHGPEHLFSFVAEEDGQVAVTAQPVLQADDLGMWASELAYYYSYYDKKKI